uniref:Uncharacterized protein n=1 Tax=Anguilla anguilla TaxID=7936 RepID=A0A0E9U4F6_ANGAN
MDMTIQRYIFCFFFFLNHVCLIFAYITKYSHGYQHWNTNVGSTLHRFIRRYSFPKRIL